MMYRQGDVLLIEVDHNERAGPQEPDPHDRIVLAEGEATGHAHAIKDRQANLYGEDIGHRFLEVLAEGGVDLVHEEHATIHLPYGGYRVVRQREYQLPSNDDEPGGPLWIAD